VIDASVDGHGKYRQVEYYDGSNLVQLLYDSFTVSGAATVDGQVQLTTIDGSKTCDVYKLSFGDTVVMESFIEPTTKIVYRTMLNDEEDHYTLTLKQKPV
jgi:predicted secreted protein